MADWDLIVAIPWVDLGLSAPMCQTMDTTPCKLTVKSKTLLADIPLTCRLPYAVYSTLQGQTGTGAEPLWGKSHQAREVKVVTWRPSLHLYQWFRRSMMLPLHMQMVRIALIFLFYMELWIVEQCQMQRGQRWLIAYASQDRSEGESEREGVWERDKNWFMNRSIGEVLHKKLKSPATIKSP